MTKKKTQKVITELFKNKKLTRKQARNAKKAVNNPRIKGTNAQFRIVLI